MGIGLIPAGSRITSATLNRIYGQADATTHTVNGTSFADVSTEYTVPGGDPSVGTAYKITAYGTGTWGSTQQTLGWTVMLNGAAVGSGAFVLSSAFSASAAVDWEAVALIVCSSTSSSGTYVASLRGNIRETANAILPGTAADNSVTFGRVTTSVTEDTTSNMTFSIQAKWASATGAPTLTGFATLFEKIN